MLAPARIQGIPARLSLEGGGVGLQRAAAARRDKPRPHRLGTSAWDSAMWSIELATCLGITRRGVKSRPRTGGQRLSTRLVLTGFVDLRAPLAVRDACTAQMHAFDAAFVCSSCREFHRPYLRSNIRMLERCAGGRRGRALLEMLAAKRVPLPCDMDLEPVERGCRRHLAGHTLEDEPAMQRFVARVLDRDGKRSA